jgi:hypothetical protein
MEPKGQTADDVVYARAASRTLITVREPMHPEQRNRTPHLHLEHRVSDVSPPLTMMTIDNLQLQRSESESESKGVERGGVDHSVAVSRACERGVG